MMTPVCPSNQDLCAFHHGTLSLAVLDAVADHLEACDHCQEALRRLDNQHDPVLASLRRASAPVRPPRLPGYEVLALLGEGGMGVVYKARHLKLNRLVALKLIHPVRGHSRARFLA